MYVLGVLARSTGGNPRGSFSAFLRETPYNIGHDELLVEHIPWGSGQHVEMLDSVFLFVHIIATFP